MGCGMSKPSDYAGTSEYRSRQKLKHRGHGGAGASGGFYGGGYGGDGMMTQSLLVTNFLLLY